MKPAIPPDESERLEDLRAYGVLDTEREPAFERLAQLAATLFEVPMALINLVDQDRSWVKAGVGIDHGTEAGREEAFCSHTILRPEPLVVRDLREDPRFAQSPYVLSAPRLRFYAGAPLTTPSGHHLGALCVMDSKPRELSPLQEQVLKDLSALVVDQLELRSARMARDRETKELRALLTGIPTPVVVLTDGRFRFANSAAEQVLGYGPGELVDKEHLAIIHPEEQQASMKVAREVLKESLGTRPTLRRVLRKNGEALSIEGSVSQVTWDGKRSLIVSMRDVTEELRSEELREQLAAEANRQLERMTAVFDVLPDGIVLFDRGFRCSYANKAIGEMFGMSTSDLIGWTPDDAARHVASLAKDPEEVLTGMKRMRTLSEGTATASVFHLVKPRPRVLRRTLHRLELAAYPFLSVWNDVTFEAAQIARREEEAFTDPLTQLMNRRGVEMKLARAQAHGGATAVALFDIDHFKRVNDTLGHGTGDAVIQLVAKVLAAEARGGDVVGRWGGEEFIAVLRTDLEGARRFAERVRAAVAEQPTPAGPITVSVGVAQNCEGCNVVEAADARLYEAKHAGRNQVAG